MKAYQYQLINVNTRTLERSNHIIRTRNFSQTVISSLKQSLEQEPIVY